LRRARWRLFHRCSEPRRLYFRGCDFPGRRRDTA
jgi:hypothetical protein